MPLPFAARPAAGSIFAILLLAATTGGVARGAEPEAPIVGGWSAVAAPAKNAEVRAAARALVAQMPRGHARLARIESAQSQSVAGINYRLTLRLADGQRWHGVVWQRLDGTRKVTELARN